MSTEPVTTVVVVDDDQDQAEILRELLQDRGYRVAAVSSADHCLGYLTEDPTAAVVITDIKMPGMSGLELCGQLRAVRPDVLTIVLTGFPDHASAMQAGAFDFILKPVGADAVDLVVQRALEHLAALRRGPAEGIIARDDSEEAST